ncbi:hypothetical protein ZWY2020_009987 [Hordeum vulgare]|nr:hypothetical protein ZWY2020_009987 [Hordeum vulgare]
MRYSVAPLAGRGGRASLGSWETLTLRRAPPQHCQGDADCRRHTAPPLWLPGSPPPPAPPREEQYAGLVTVVLSGPPPSTEDEVVSERGEATLSPMQFTASTPGIFPFSSVAGPALEIYSIRLVNLNPNLSWPIDVYGVFAARDYFDHNHNILFHRSSADSQRINKEVDNTVSEDNVVGVDSAAISDHDGKWCNVDDVVVIPSNDEESTADNSVPDSNSGKNTISKTAASRR